MPISQAELQVVITAKDEASAKLNALGVNAKQVGATFLAVGGAITTAMGFAVKAASDAQTKMANMNATLATMGVAGEKAKDGIQKAADATLKLGFDNEEAAVSITRLFQRTKDLTQATKLNTLAMDLSRAKNIDLATASNLVGQVLSGNGKVLKQYGIDIKDSATPLQALGDLQDKVAGQATAFAKTFAGQAEILKQQFGELQEKIGEQLLPIISELVAKITPVIEKLVEWAGAHPELTKWVVLATAGLGVMLTVIGSLILVMPLITTALAVFGVVLAFVAANPIVLIIGALVALGMVIVALIRHWQEIKDKTIAIWDGLSGSAQGWIKLMFIILTGGLGLIVIMIANHWEEVKAITQSIWDSIAGVVIGAINAIQVVIDKIIQSYNKAKSILSVPLNIVGSAVSKVGSATNVLLGGKKADGGSVSSGNPFLVGERGPEVFVPNQSGNIIPNGGFGGIVVNINGGTYLSESVALDIGNMIVNKLKNIARITR